MALRLRGLFVYPIKSLRGIAVAEAEVRAAGLRHDRRWMVVDEQGRAVTQRTEPRLAWAEMSMTDEGYRVTTPAGSVVVPPTLEGSRVPASVWKASVEVVVHPEASALLSGWLGHPLRLVHLPEDFVRAVGPHAPDARVSLADGHPYLVIGEASLADLNARIDGPALPMARFRPNFVVEGSEAYAEDGWAGVRIGALRFRGVKRCDRCVMTTLDPKTGEAGDEPLRTLATYRREHGKVWFGMHLVPEGDGTVRVGDPVVPDPT